MIRMMYIVYRVHGVHYEYVGMSFVFSRSTKKILGMQRQARRAVFIAVRLFDTDKKATKLNRGRIFTESQVCFSRTSPCPAVPDGPRILDADAGLKSGQKLK